MKQRYYKSLLRCTNGKWNQKLFSSIIFSKFVVNTFPMSEEPLMIFKKPSYPIKEALLDYLERFDRISKFPIAYDDLLRFSGSINVYDKEDQDTLWIRVYYNEFEREEIDLTLKKIYSLLHSDGNLDIIKF